MKSLVIASATVLSIAAGINMGHAQVAYDDSVLNGCYAHLATSVDTGSAAVNQDSVGTTCFDGKGHIRGNTTSPSLSGGITNRNGTISRHTDVTGTYKVTNSPGDGMGIMEGTCTKHAFVLKHVENGLAHGYSFILIGHKGCKSPGPEVFGGSAEYQGPLK